MHRSLVIFILLVLQSSIYQRLLAQAPALPAITPSSALQSYLHNGDTVFHWEVKDSFNVSGVRAYTLLLVSQQWREYTWTHQLTIFIPPYFTTNSALLFITGGSNQQGVPKWIDHQDPFQAAISRLAIKNHAWVAVLRQTPNQPLFKDLYEDQIISYTLHQFNNDHDYTWPLLFPMVKTAVKAMDAIQQFSMQQFHYPIHQFVVSGASKRGWTTWLTGASDPRVVAIAPMVIDILNMGVNLDYQIKAWHQYSPQIEDYVKLGIPQATNSESGAALNTMIDPYSYRKNLRMPKMIFMGTNDEYWVVDAIKNYIDSIPGKNLIHYIPNVGHDLGDGKDAMNALSAFFGISIHHQPYPACSWKSVVTRKGITISIKTSRDLLVGASVWSANSSNMIFTKSSWTARNLHIEHQPEIKLTEPLPSSGYKAFYIDLQYKNPAGGMYTASTRMFVTNVSGLQ